MNVTPRSVKLSFMKARVIASVVYVMTLSVTLRTYVTLPTSVCIILVGNQLDAQFLLLYVYLNPLHVSSKYVPVLRRTIV